MRPSTRFTAFVASGAALGLLPIFFGPVGVLPWAVFLVASFAVVLVELARVVRPSQVEIVVECPSQVPVGVPCEIAILHEVVSGVDRRSGRIEARIDLSGDYAAEEIEPVPAPRVRCESVAEKSPSPTVRHTCEVTPTRRGRLTVDLVWLRWRSPWGVLRVTRATRVRRSVRVVPDLAMVRKSVLRFSSRDAAVGLKVERFLGDGSEFESLREFVPGFDTRALDWKASARHRSLLVRQFRAERNHQVIVGFDTGWLMREAVDGLPKLDHAIQAGLVLVHLALGSGDRVGLCAFDARVQRFVSPQSGLGSFRRLQSETAELDYSTAETNYALGFADLATRVRRRSLVVFFTDFVDTVTAELLVDSLSRLAERHLVLFVTLRDPRLDRLVDKEPSEIGDIGRAVLARDRQLERERVLERLGQLGVRCLEVPPHAAAAGVVQQYLEIRRKELVG